MWFHEIRNCKVHHIRARRSAGYFHHGLLFGDGSVVHFSGEPLEKTAATICRTTLADFAAASYGRWEAVNYDHRLCDDHAVMRANSRLNAGRYNLALNNCEHFASWAVTGLHESSQVPSLAARFASAGKRLVLFAKRASRLERAMALTDAVAITGTLHQIWLVHQRSLLLDAAQPSQLVDKTFTRGLWLVLRGDEVIDTRAALALLYRNLARCCAALAKISVDRAINRYLHPDLRPYQKESWMLPGFHLVTAVNNLEAELGRHISSGHPPPVLGLHGPIFLAKNELERLASGLNQAGWAVADRPSLISLAEHLQELSKNMACI